MGSLPFGVVPFIQPDDDSGGFGGGVGSSPSFLTSSWDSIENWFGGRNADTTGMSPSMAQTAQTAKSISNVGLLTSVLGGISSAIGTFYAAKSAQYQEKSQASSLAYQSDMASINSSRAEQTAESIEEAGKSQIADYTMRAGQQKAAAMASMGARGIALGVGSAADVAASMDVEKDLTTLAINRNTTARAWAAREQGTNYANEALIDRTSAVNALRSAKSISPMGGMMNSLLSSATQVAGQWDWNRWMRMRLAAGAPAPMLGLGTGS
ncbi:MAG TPA: hypothetical protein VGR47_06015 [Terracidiphilus sp.]|nr:hypothetical protein [Terracidiphilus sp.]